MVIPKIFNQSYLKGAGHGSISRAFYARKELIAEIFNDN